MKCFHHNDLDGRCAGALVSIYMDDKNPEDFIEVDYSKVPDASLVSRGEDVFIVDYCFSDKTIYQLEGIIDKGCHVIWIDHHKTSSDLLLRSEDYPFLKASNLRIVVDTKLCGAVLTYKYFEYETGGVMPRFLRYVDDWDRWTKRYSETYKFKLGVESVHHAPTDQIWKSLMFTPDTTEHMLQEGDIIERYVDKSNAEYCKAFAFPCVFEGMKCYALNIRANSKVFGKLIDEADAVITFVYDGLSYRYSIYSSKDYVDCAAIAEKFGGGGHKGAAGFESDRLYVRKEDWK